MKRPTSSVRYSHPSPPRLARVWLVHWLNIAPTIKRYQHPVSLSRVLADHRAALAAEPIEETER